MADNRFSNKSRLMRKLSAIPQEVQDAVRAQNNRNANDLVDAIKPFVPVEEGDLRDSVKARDITDAERIRAKVTAGEGGQEEKARAQEFGRPDMAAQPFFFPVYRTLKRTFRRRNSASARKAIKAVIKRG